MSIEYPTPKWFQNLYYNYIAGNYHQFIFYNNVFDEFFWPSPSVWNQNKKIGQAGELYPFREFIVRTLFILNYKKVFFYTPTNGLNIFSPESDSFYPRGVFTESDNNFQDYDSIKNLGEIVSKIVKNNMPINSQLIVQSGIDNLIFLEHILTKKWLTKDNEPIKTAVIVDFSENIVPENRHFNERILRWGLDREIYNNGNISILITEDIQNLSPQLRSDDLGSSPIPIPFPDPEYRQIFFEHSLQTLPETSLGQLLSNPDQLKRVVQSTRGFQIKDCRIIENISKAESEEVGSGQTGVTDYMLDGHAGDIHYLIDKEKRNVIQAASKGMLEPVSSNITFDSIGGLEGAKEYFKKVGGYLRDMIDRKESENSIPKAILMAGPPGTGKTLMAKAMARESGISLVKMGDIRSQWVGESEKNLTNTLALLKAMAPVIVFIDEIDQAVGSRSSGSGDSGVNARIFGKILEFMGDNDNRGDVVWIAATNRADFLDDAMLRRFDQIIPVLLPGSAPEWNSIIEGISNQIGLRIVSTDREKFVSQNIHKLTKNHSGSTMETILRNAAQDAVDNKLERVTCEGLNAAFKRIKTNFNQNMYVQQTLLSLCACNDISMIPVPDASYSYGQKDLDEAVKKMFDELTNTPLYNHLNTIRGGRSSSF